MQKPDKSFWLEQIERWKESGLSIKKFCKDEGLIEHKFYHWKKKLSQNTSNDFIEAVEKKSPGHFCITLSNGMSLTFDSLPEASWLGNFIKECSGDFESR